MEQRRCAGCMSITTGPVCEHCGWPETKQNEPHQLPVGTMLREQYTVGRVLGQGGFGITYLGWDEYLDTPVAIKEYYPNFLVNRESALSRKVHCFTEAALPQYQKSKARFLREAKALAKFQEEPAIVRIRSFFEEHETAYIVMEYVRGTDLAHYVQGRGGRLSAAETLRILKPVMEALEAVHQAGLVHRDISPDNVMLHPRGGAKLLDFGAARELEDGSGENVPSRSTETIVKHGFAPIEQYQTRGALGPWTDVYALCATVWYCLTGRIPEEAITRITEQEPMEWDKIPGLTARQAKTLEKGMAVQRRDRLHSVRELIDGLYGQELPDTPDLRAEAIAQLKQELREEVRAELRKELEQEIRKDRKQKQRTSPVKISKKTTGIIAAVLALVVSCAGLWAYLANRPGFRKEHGDTYYYTEAGNRLTACFADIDGDRYYFAANGKMQIGWRVLNGDRYYFGPDGKMIRGCLLELDGETYYLNSDGIMQTGTHILNGVTYVFGPDGRLR